MNKEELLISPVGNTGFSCCKATDAQVGGSHYKDMKIQPITFILENNIPFCEANVIKYVCRHRNKNGVEDLLKAKHYIDLIIEHEYKNKIDQ